MPLSPHEKSVNTYYDVHTDEFYLVGWDPEHIHFGIFDQAKDAEYAADPMKALADREPAVLRMTDLIVSSARIQDGDVVVDAGCGVGGTAFYVAERAAASVTGVNINEKQLGIARQRAEERGLAGKVSFQWADCSQALPFDDESVDVILNIESACHYSDRRRFLAECARVLRPGGRLAAQDWMAADDLSPEEARRQLQALCDAWFLAPLDSLSSYRGLLEGAGLTVTHAAHIEDGIMPNAYIMHMGYLGMVAREASLSDYERANQERFRTFSQTLLEGTLKVGHYVAEKL